MERLTNAESIEELQAEVLALEQLMRRARAALGSGIEAKLIQLTDAILRDEGLAARGEKLLIFTEAKDTLTFLVSQLRAQGFKVAVIEGSLSMDQRLKKLSMTWDFVETAPLGFGSGSWESSAANVWGSIQPLLRLEPAVEIRSGSADDLPFPDGFFDAVVTDPPYYDAVHYSDLSDFFYGIHRRALRTVFPDLFGGNGCMTAAARRRPAAST